MKKYIVICFLLAFISSLVFYLRNKDSSSPIRHAEWEFGINEDELSDVEVKASQGDCNSSLRLMKYHMNFTLKYNDALHWGRIAAKCDQSEPKELLLVLLLQRQAEEVIKIETDALLVSIEKIDSKRASGLSEEVNKWRKQKEQPGQTTID